MRKRDKHYKHWSKSGRSYDQKKFLEYKLQKGPMRSYLGNILGLNNETEWWPRHGSALKGKKNKKLYSLLKHSKQESNGIASLKRDGQTASSETDQANTLNDQFQSVFSPKTPVSLKSRA